MKTTYLHFLTTGALIFVLTISSIFAQTDGTRIKFKRGSSSAKVSGTVAKGGPDFYIVGAKAGQTMTVKVTGNVSFGIDSPDDTLTEDDSNKRWSEELTDDGDYRIRVYSFGARGAGENYTLTVSIK